MLRKLGLALLSLTIAVLLVGVLSLFLPLDLGWRFWQVRTRLFGETAIGIHRPDARLGFAHIPNAVGRQQHFDFDVTYTIDAHGCRTIPAPSQPTARVMFLGCSFTFGHGVADDEAYPAVLAKRWPTARVENHAVNAWGTSQAYQTLADQAARTDHPRVVIYAWLSHHAHRNYVRRYWLEQMARSNQQVPHFEIQQETLRFQGVVGPEAGVENSAALTEKELELTVRFFEEMAKQCNARQATFVVVFLPDPVPFAGITDRIQKELERLHIPLIDVRDVKGSHFQHDGHPQADWHQAIADRLAEHPLLRFLSGR